MASNSCEKERACAASADCDAITRCFPACPSEDCTDTCMASHGLDIAWFYAPPDAPRSTLTSTYADFALARTACSVPAGNYWECVGHLSWRPVNAAFTTLETRVADNYGAGVAGVDVAICDVNDVDCRMPWRVGRTDDAGLVTLQVPLPNDHPGASFTKVSSSATSLTKVFPSYAFGAWPLTEARKIGSYGRINGDKTGVPGVVVSEVDAAAQAAIGSGITLDPMRAVVAVSVQDCLGVRAPGTEVTLSSADNLTVTIDPSGAPIPPVTTSAGGLTFVNVPAGGTHVTAKLPGIGTLGTFSVYIHPSSFHLIILRPTPL
jgi:hypothetical protein